MDVSKNANIDKDNREQCILHQQNRVDRQLSIITYSTKETADAGYHANKNVERHG